MLLIIVISWVILSFIVADVAKKKGRNYSDYFLLSLLINPLVGFIVLLIRGDSDWLRLIKVRQEEEARIAARNDTGINTKPFSRTNKYESLEKLAGLLERSIISREEFEEEKKKILLETYTNSNTEVLKQNDDSIINVKIISSLQNLIVKEKRKGIFEKSNKDVIINYITNYCTTKDNCIKIIKEYKSHYNSDLIVELRTIYSPFIIKDALKVFIAFGIIEEKYPHNIIDAYTL